MCSVLHSRNVPFLINGDTRNSCGPSVYIPNKGSMKRCESDRQAKASLKNVLLVRSFANKLALRS